MKLFDLSGRVALVTGGNGGIGLGIACGLAEAGARVVISGRNAAKAGPALAAIARASAGGSPMFLDADLGAEAACTDLVARAVGETGRLDILVNNAGTFAFARADLVDMAAFRAVLETNVTAMLALARAAYPHFRAAGGGKIVNVSSATAHAIIRGNLAYNTSKTAVVGLTRSLAGDWGPDNIQVNAIIPGFIETDMTLPSKEHVPGLADRVIARTPAQRWGTPEDLKGTAIFLASAASDFVTGATIVADGGFTAVLY